MIDPGKKLRKKKCRSCKEWFNPVSHWSTTCSVVCAIMEVKKAQEKKRKKYLKQRKEALKTRSDWIDDAKKAFNRFIRFRDKDLPCISCGTTNPKLHLTGGSWDCGHYRSVGSAPELRFEEMNCRKQCKKCNRDRSGNVVEYRINLLKIIGEDDLRWLEGPHEPKRYTIEDLKKICEHYKQKVKCDG